MREAAQQGCCVKCVARLGRTAPCFGLRYVLIADVVAAADVSSGRVCNGGSIVEGRHAQSVGEAGESRVRDVHQNRSPFEASRGHFIHIREIAARCNHIDVSSNSTSGYPALHVVAAGAVALISRAKHHLCEVEYAYLSKGI